METKNYQHTTVLLHEAVDELLQASVNQDPVFVDGTFGRGGHSRLILSQLPANGRLIAFDKDVEAIAEADTKPGAVAGKESEAHSPDAAGGDRSGRFAERAFHRDFLGIVHGDAFGKARPADHADMPVLSKLSVQGFRP